MTDDALMRLYGNPDATPDGQDWIKGGRWDHTRDPQVFFDAVLRRDEDEWAHFKTLPVFRAMPLDMIHAVDRLFGNQRNRAIQARRSSGRDGGR